MYERLSATVKLKTVNEWTSVQCTNHLMQFNAITTNGGHKFLLTNYFPMKYVTRQALPSYGTRPAMSHLLFCGSQIDSNDTTANNTGNWIVINGSSKCVEACMSICDIVSRIDFYFSIIWRDDKKCSRALCSTYGVWLCTNGRIIGCIDLLLGTHLHTPSFLHCFFVLFSRIYRLSNGK